MPGSCSTGCTQGSNGPIRHVTKCPNYNPDPGTHAELIAEARSYGPFTASDGERSFAVAPHSLTLALAAALEEADRQLAEVNRDQERQHRRAHDEMRKRQAAEAALKQATDALEKAEDALRDIIDVHEGWTREMDYGERGDVTKQIAHAALAAVRQEPQP